MTAATDPAVSEWKGFVRHDRVVDGRAAIVVLPRSAARGRPWIWRTEFFGVFDWVDLALLEAGFHLAYIDVTDMYGAPRALDHMDRFYEVLRQTYRLSPKVVLEGFSRGALFALNWAIRRPTQTQCLYLDAPVCDFRSWPGGKGRAPGSPEDWTRLKASYGLTEDQAAAYAGNPLDNLEPLAAAAVPILAVYGEADLDLPIEENVLVLLARFRGLGGEILTIGKPGVGHHPHSLEAPAPIVDFILAHSRSCDEPARRRPRPARPSPGRSSPAARPPRRGPRP